VVSDAAASTTYQAAVVNPISYALEQKKMTTFAQML
jgi:hypothetical protein